MKLIYKIVEAIKESEHEVVLPLYDILDGEINQNDAFYIKKLNRWLDELQEMYDKAERFDDLYSSLRQIDNYIEDADSAIEDIRRSIDVIDI
tara:strand:- start:14 stop:289 length:276 start_codon:yes stop_codon:yes gene_type:complete